MPAYVNADAELRAKGIQAVLAVCSNDAAVAGAWAVAQKTEGTLITVVGDPRLDLAKEMNLVLEAPPLLKMLGTPRIMRFAMFVDDGVIKSFKVSGIPKMVEGDGGMEVSLPPQVMEDMAKL